MYNLYKINRKILKIFTNDHYNDTVTKPNYFDVIRAFIIKDVFLENINDKNRGFFMSLRTKHEVETNFLRYEINDV